MTAPIPVLVRRHKCPHCPRIASRPGRVREHMARCWYNPAARGCKTCVHFDQDPGDAEIGLVGGESCAVGVSLAGRPACPGCGGHGLADTNWGGQKPCGPDITPAHVGDGAEVKPGLIVHCDSWKEAS